MHARYCAHAHKLGAQLSFRHLTSKLVFSIELSSAFSFSDLLLSTMTPPLPWHLSLMNGEIRLYKNGQLMLQDKGPDAGKEYGYVTSAEVAVNRDKELLRVSLE